MWRLTKTILILGVLAMAAWMAWTVKLGDRTLVGHLKAIVRTEESKKLMEGTKEKVGDLVDQAGDGVVNRVAKRSPGKVTMRGEGGGVESGAVPQVQQAPKEKLSPEDRKALRRMIGQGQVQPSE